MKDWDFGYFGKGLDGYVHYKQAFDRNFPQDRTPSPPVRHGVRPARTFKEDDSADTDDVLTFLGILIVMVFVNLALFALQALLRQ